MLPVQMSSSRANQIVCTGITTIVLGCVTLAIGYLLSFGKYHLSSLLGDGAAFWAGIPAVFAGIIGILTGVYKKTKLVKLFLFCSLCSFCLSVLMAAVVGIMLRDWRQRGECQYTYCPFDEVSILLILVISILVLLSILAMTGILEASFPLEDSENDSYRGYAHAPLYAHSLSPNGDCRRLVGYEVREANDRQIPVQTTV